MTESEARRLAEIASKVDGGCSVCVAVMADRLSESFPQWPWHEWLGIELPVNRGGFYEPEYEPVE